MRAANGFFEATDIIPVPRCWTCKCSSLWEKWQKWSVPKEINELETTNIWSISAAVTFI